MFHLAAVNLYGEAIAEETVAVPFAQSDAYYDGIASSLESFLDRNGYDREKILGVSIATRESRRRTGSRCFTERFSTIRI